MNGPTFAPARHAAPAPRPVAPRAAKPAGKPDLEGGNGLRVFTYLRLHWLMILFCGSLLGGGLGYAAWELLASKFESTALFYVESAPTAIASQNKEQARTDFVTYVKTTAALIKSDFVLNAALRDLKDVPTVRDQKDPIKFLEEEVQVSWKDGSEVVYLSYKGHNAGDVKKIVDAVQGAFMSEWVMTDFQRKKNFMQQIQDARIDLQKILEKHEKSPNGRPGVVPAGGVVPPGGVVNANGVQPPGLLPLPGMADPAPVANPPGMMADETLKKLNQTVIVGRIERYQQDLEKLPALIEDAKRRMMATEARMKVLKESPADSASVQAVEKDNEVIERTLRMKFVKRKYEMMKGAGDPTAPGVLRLEEDWHAEEQTLEKLKKEKLYAIEGLRRTEEAKKLLPEWQEAERTVKRLSDQYTLAQTNLAKTEKMLKEMPLKGVAQAGFLEDKDGPGYSPADTVVRTEDGVLSALVRQYLLTKMELDSPQRVRVLQKGSNPAQKDLKKQIIGTVAASLMGFGLIAMGVVAFETVSRRVSSLSDLQSAGPCPVVGVIPCLPGEAIGKDSNKRAAANEAIDRLRSYVAQTWLARGATTIALTSATGDEGKAFAAFGLASSLAQGGYRTLLVDFDLRDPALHAFAGLPNLNGVCEVLRGEVDARKAVQFLPSGLHMLTAGRWSDEARKAAVGDKLEELLNRLKEPYDCLVLHGHALLTAAESIEVARRCEVVLVCALYRETKAPLLRKATDRLASMEIPYSGVVYVGASESEALC